MAALCASIGRDLGGNAGMLGSLTPSQAASGSGSASIWSGGKFAVWSDGRARLEECAFLYQRES